MIVHICGAAGWDAAQKNGEYHPASLEMEGFIHASLPEQVLRVANRFYAGRKSLLLLWIDPQYVRPEIRFEPADGEVYPHIYGALNLEAVQAVSEFSPDADGAFRRLPTAPARGSLP